VRLVEQNAGGLLATHHAAVLRGSGYPALLQPPPPSAWLMSLNVWKLEALRMFAVFAGVLSCLWGSINMRNLFAGRSVSLLVSTTKFSQTLCMNRIVHRVPQRVPTDVAPEWCRTAT